MAASDDLRADVERPDLPRRGVGYVVATVAEIPPGERKLVTVRGRPIAVFNVDGTFFALLNRCPHQGASLCHGHLTGRLSADRPGEFQYEGRGEILRCPWHGWEFELSTGQSWFDPKHTTVKTYPVEVSDGETICKGPYRAETFEVTTDGDYVVLKV